MEVDRDLPERSYWLLAPGREAVDWAFVDWALSCWEHFKTQKSWPELESSMKSVPMAPGPKDEGNGLLCHAMRSTVYLSID